MALIGSTPVLATWELHEETTVKGNISGTIKNGSVITMQSGSIYEVTEFTIKIALELAPDALVLKDGDQFKLVVKGFDGPLICKQLVPPAAVKSAQQTNSKTTPSPEVPSSKNLPLEKLISLPEQRQLGIEKLTQEERERLRVFLISLYIKGVEQGKRGQAATSSSDTTPSSNATAIESQIDGDFEGWEGETDRKSVG